MTTKFIQDTVRELKTEVQNTKKKAKALSVTDEAGLYYTGIITGLQLAIGKYEQWLFNVQPKGKRKPRRKQR